MSRYQLEYFHYTRVAVRTINMVMSSRSSTNVFSLFECVTDFTPSAIANIISSQFDVQFIRFPSPQIISMKNENEPRHVCSYVRHGNHHLLQLSGASVHYPPEHWRKNFPSVRIWRPLSSTEQLTESIFFWQNFPPLSAKNPALIFKVAHQRHKDIEADAPTDYTQSHLTCSAFCAHALIILVRLLNLFALQFN